VSRERVRQIEQRARHKLEAELHGLAAELAWPMRGRTAAA
jgi:DNA-directed RNA polymerase sigma subunit (sigma70/sigma32)